MKNIPPYKVTDWNLQAATRFINSVNKAREKHGKPRPIDTSRTVEILEGALKEAKHLYELEGRLNQYSEEHFQFLRRRFMQLRDHVSVAANHVRNSYHMTTAPKNDGRSYRSMSPRDILDFHDNCAPLTVNYSNRRISTVSDDIVLSDGCTEVHLGPFEISIQWDASPEKNAYEWVRAKALKPNPAADRSEVTHPHVSEGHICLGDAEATVQDAFRDGRLLDIFEVILSLLRTYNEESPYVELGDWFESRTTCCCCGERSSSTSECGGCSDETCGSCSQDCEDCGTTMCRNCLHDCRVCFERFCTSCLTKMRYAQARVRGFVCTTCSRGCEDCGTRFVPAAWSLPPQSPTCADCTVARKKSEEEEKPDTAPISGVDSSSPETREPHEPSHTVGAVVVDAPPGSVNIDVGTEVDGSLLINVGTEVDGSLLINFLDHTDDDSEVDDDFDDDFDDEDDSDDDLDDTADTDDGDSDDSDGVGEAADPEWSGPTGWLDSPVAPADGPAAVDAPGEAATGENSGEAESLFAALSRVLP